MNFGCSCSPVSGLHESCPEHGWGAVWLQKHSDTHPIFKDDCRSCVTAQVKAQHIMLRWLGGLT